MDSLNEQIVQLQTAYTSYQQKQSKSTGTNLRKCLMNVSKSVGLARKEVLESMKASVKPRVLKESKDEQQVFEVHQDNENDADTEPSETPIEKPKKRVRKPKA